MRFRSLLGTRQRPTHLADPDRHRRKCHVCNHPDRAKIDADFLSWRPATEIVDEYRLLHRSILYRHTEATGLSRERKELFHTVLDRIVEQVESVPVTGATILRALRAYSQLRPDGRWVELFTQVSLKPVIPSRRKRSRRS